MMLSAVRLNVPGALFTYALMTSGETPADAILTTSFAVYESFSPESDLIGVVEAVTGFGLPSVVVPAVILPGNEAIAKPVASRMAVIGIVLNCFFITHRSF